MLINMADDLDKIMKAGHHLLNIIADILDISKIEMDKVELLDETIDIHQILNDIIETSRPLIAKNNNTCEVEIDPNLTTMQADSTKIRQIILNLTSNAAKFTKNGTIRITADTMDDQLVVKVIDTGIGMTSAQIEKVFQPFVQADGSTTREYGGTGLGLAISQRLSVIMGGGLSVESVIDQSSTFTLTLPLRKTSKIEVG